MNTAQSTDALGRNPRDLVDIASAVPSDFDTGACKVCRESLSIVSHDIKSAVGIIAGYLDILLSQRVGPLTQGQISFLHEMKDSTERVQQFTKEFLILCSLRSPSVKPDLQVADIRECLSGIAEFWSPAFERQGIACYFLDKSEPVDPFPFDACKVQHILSNLLDNALKFTPPGGTVWIEVTPHFWERRITSTKWPEERRNRTQSVNAVKVSVSDTGPGIAPEYHRDIFDDFRQLRRIHEPRDRGVGLGLAIARRLVEVQNGKIWVESAPGSGSIFSFLLPFAQPN